jgi:hypothetical protein
MGIRFRCPICDKKIHVKDFLAGKRGICPKCDAGVDIPLVSQLPPSLNKKSRKRSGVTTVRDVPAVASSTPSPTHGRLIGTTEYPTVDPLIEFPKRPWFVATPDGRDLGPLAASEVREMIDVGDIVAETSVRRDDWPIPLVAAAVWQNWKGADPFAAVFAKAAPADTPSPSASPAAVASPAADNGPSAEHRTPQAVPLHAAAPVAAETPTAQLPPAIGKAPSDGSPGISQPAPDFPSSPPANAAGPPVSAASVNPPAPADSRSQADSAAPASGLYYSRGSIVMYVAAAVMIVLVIGVLAVAAYRVIFDPPAWLRPQQEGARPAHRPIVELPLALRNYP